MFAFDLEEVQQNLITAVNLEMSMNSKTFNGLIPLFTLAFLTAILVTSEASAATTCSESEVQGLRTERDAIQRAIHQQAGDIYGNGYEQLQIQLKQALQVLALMAPLAGRAPGATVGISEQLARRMFGVTVASLADLDSAILARERRDALIIAAKPMTEILTTLAGRNTASRLAALQLQASLDAMADMVVAIHLGDPLGTAGGGDAIVGSLLPRLGDTARYRSPTTAARREQAGQFVNGQRLWRMHRAITQEAIKSMYEAIRNAGTRFDLERQRLSMLGQNEAALRRLGAYTFRLADCGYISSDALRVVNPAPVPAPTAIADPRLCSLKQDKVRVYEGELGNSRAALSYAQSTRNAVAIYRWSENVRYMEAAVAEARAEAAAACSNSNFVR
jgi:hypothetical protein